MVVDAGTEGFLGIFGRLGLGLGFEKNDESVLATATFSFLTTVFGTACAPLALCTTDTFEAGPAFA